MNNGNIHLFFKHQKRKLLNIKRVLLTILNLLLYKHYVF